MEKIGKGGDGNGEGEGERGEDRIGLGSGVVSREGVSLTRCLIVASELDTVFCSGADLKERRGMTRGE